MNHDDPIRGKWLIWLLRIIGTVDLFALIAVLAPRAWIASSHQLLGLGTFPTEPIAGYLARCTSIWYASYGLLLWFVSFDISKYSALITFAACVMLIQGVFVIGIDISEQMPWWWICLEGPCCSALGAIILAVQRTSGWNSSARPQETQQGTNL